MDPNKAFDALTNEFFESRLKHDPLFAVSIGFLEGNAERMPDGTLKAELEGQKHLQKLHDQLKAIDLKKLSASRHVDHALALHLVELWRFEREELKLWEMIPEAPHVVGLAIYQVLAKSTMPLNLRIRAIMKRLEHMPKYIDDSRQKLVRPVKLFVEHELETLSRLPAFFNHVKDVSRDHLPPTPQRQLHRLLEDVQTALQKYEDWLIIDVLGERQCEKERWWIGEELYRKLLAKRGITMVPGSILKWAEEEVERLRERLKEIGRTIKRKVMVEDVRDICKSQHPDNFDGALRYSRDAVGKLKQFVQRSKFAALPEHAGAIFVVDTPIFLRHRIPLGTHLSPAKYESKDGKKDGYYLVTPGDCDSDKLKEHNYASLLWRAVHNAYPGHHLQNAWAVVHPSKWRTFAKAPESVEGWAHYCEERVREMGYDENPPSKFMGASEALFRAGMAVMDVKLALGKMGMTQAVEYLIDNVGMDRIAAEAEVRRYVATPTYGVSYLYGKEKIKELKKAVKERMRARFTETFFHTAVLQTTPLPMPLLEREVMWRADEELKKPAPKPEDEPKGKHAKGAAAKDAAAKGAKSTKDAKAPPAKEAKEPAAKAAPKPKAEAKAKPKARPAPKSKPKPKAKTRPKPKRKR